MGDVRSDPYPNRPFSGQVASPGSGTVTQLPDVVGVRGTLVAHPDNSETVWVGFESGTVGSTSGYPLLASGDPLYLEGLDNLDLLYAVFDGGSDRLCWMMHRPLQTR